MKKKIGHYSFIVGVVLAILLGVASIYLGALAPWLTSLLIVLGLIVGFINVGGKETKDFIMIALALVLVSYAGGVASTLTSVQYVGGYLTGILNAIMAFVVPATVVVCLKQIYLMSEAK